MFLVFGFSPIVACVTAYTGVVEGTLAALCTIGSPVGEFDGNVTRVWSCFLIKGGLI